VRWRVLSGRASGRKRRVQMPNRCTEQALNVVKFATAEESGNAIWRMRAASENCDASAERGFVSRRNCASFRGWERNPCGDKRSALEDVSRRLLESELKLPWRISRVLRRSACRDRCGAAEDVWR
jgi:hypothetical protein